MRILITDDEHLARQRIERLLTQLGEHQIEHAENGVDAVNLCQKKSFDVAFLDIRMPEMDGLEAAYHLSKMDTPPAIVFVTAYDDYALKAFSVNAIDYVLKPVKQEQLAEALNKTSKLNQVQVNQLNLQSESKARNHISTRLRGDIHLIPLKDILFFQADQKYVTVRHLKGEALIEEPLKQLENEFCEQFIRIHRNALVNKDFIQSLIKDNNGHLVISLKHCDKNLEVSRRHASEVKKLIKQL